MDIFEEIKEAVLSATPGEDTRNYYRNQGMKIEQERIIKLLENNSVVDSIDAIALIKGEQDEDACEPSDSPCVNGWSCQKHRMTIEQMTDFIALIEGEK